MTPPSGSIDCARTRTEARDRGQFEDVEPVDHARLSYRWNVLFSAMPFVRDKRLKVIALASPTRAESDPEIPLIAETVPGFSARSFIGVIAPAGVPKPLLRQISADIGRTVKTAALTDRMTKLGMEPVGSSSDEYDTLIREEIDKWTKVVQTAGIKVN